MDLIDTDPGYVEYDDPITELPIDGDQVAEALVKLARDLPAGIDQGRPLFAQFDPREYAVRLLTTTGLWWVYPAHLERMAVAVEGQDPLYEVTSWVGGRENDRYARRRADLRPPSPVD